VLDANHILNPGKMFD